MARSKVVYVVMISGEPVVGFTVKHELKTWVGGNYRPGMVVYRVPDGRYASRHAERIDLTHLFEESK